MQHNDRLWRKECCIDRLNPQGMKLNQCRQLGSENYQIHRIKEFPLAHALGGAAQAQAAFPIDLVHPE